ncbi:MAG: mercuric transporter MerT family protein [Thermoanaerobaculia bacterium]
MKSHEPQGRRPYGALGAGAAGAGSALAAVLASSCCIPVIAPLIVAVLGASGAAWAAGLKPYSPYILAGSLALLLYGLWTVYRPRPACSPEVCPTGGAGRGVKAVLWVAVALWAVAALLNVFLPSF